MSIVPTNVNYTYSLLVQNLYALLIKYPFLNVQVVGNSRMGKDIFVCKLGNGAKKVFYSGSIHANESITSVVLMKFIEDYCASYVNNGSLYGYSIRELFDSCSIFIMPMVNPDGVDLVNGDIDVNSLVFKNAVSISNNFPAIPFPDGWKANIEGVDFKNYQPTCKVL